MDADKLKRSLPNFFLILFMILLPPGTGISRNAVSYNREGWDLLKKGYTYRAIFSFKNALSQNNKFRSALLGLGRAYYKIEAYNRAIDFFNRVLQLDENSDDALVGLGLSFTKLGKFTLAMDYFNRAVKISEENLDAKYGIAYLYYSMDRMLWAKRKIEGILKTNPYHVDTLLLLADIMSSEKRLKEARKYVEKAIEIDSESPAGFIKLGEILFSEYIKIGDKDLLENSIESLENALSIQPESFPAYRIYGNIYLYRAERAEKDDSETERLYKSAIEKYREALKLDDNYLVHYNLALSYDRTDRINLSLNHFLKALKIAPNDSILTARFEDFLVMRDYKIGHPARVIFNKDRYALAVKNAKKHLVDLVILYLRRSLLLNPMDRKAREMLLDYYSAMEYNRMYIEEMKSLQRLFPGKEYQNRIASAIIKRRERLYHKEGFSSELPPRDVPRILVMNFDSDARIADHSDAGYVIGSMLDFVMSQFGRMETGGFRERPEHVNRLFSDGQNLEKSMEILQNKIKKGELKKIDYVIYGSFHESGNNISVNFNIMNFRKGVIISRFNVSESGFDSLIKLCLNAARKVFDVIPYRGRVLKINDDGIVINLGLYDGLKPGSKLAVYKYRESVKEKRNLREKIIFTIKESDTLISFAVPQKKDDLERINSSEKIFPIKKRRARLIK